MKKHIASVYAGKNLFEYKICDKNFANKFTLTTHTASIHEQKSIQMLNL